MYKPYPIYDMKSGKRTNREPWLIPQDAFVNLDNCYLKRGVLEKRNGKSAFGQHVSINTSTNVPTLDTDPIMGIKKYYSGSTQQLLVMDQDRANSYITDAVLNVTITAFADAGGGEVSVTASSHGFVTGDIVTISGTTNYNGTFYITKVDNNTFKITDTWVSDDATGTANQETLTDLTRNKIRYADGTQDISPTAGIVVEGATSGAYGTVEGHVLDHGAIATNTADGTIVFVNGSVSGTFQDAETLQRTTLAFTSGGTYEVVVGNTITGATSTETAVVAAITLSSGTWAGGDAAGTFDLVTQSGAFQSENLNVGAELNVATIAGDSTVESVGTSDGANTDDEFTGDNTNYFQIANWNDVGYIVNDKDPLQKYNGTHLTRLVVDLDTAGGSNNNLNSAKLIFIVKERIVVFNTVEDGIRYAQRGRWCDVKDPQTWRASSFKDAPTHEQIITGGFIGDDLYLWFEKSVYKFSWTADAFDPFEWIKVSAYEGASADNGLVTIEGLQYAVGPTQIQICNGRDVTNADKPIPDVVLSWTPQSVQYSNTYDLEENRQLLISYASVEASANADGNIYPDKMLILNYEDYSFSTNNIESHVFGNYVLQSDVTWETQEAWEDIGYSWESGGLQAGFPISLIGDHSGIIYKINTGTTDDGTAIEMNAKSGRWNPFVKQGQQVTLGYIDFLVDVDDNASFDVESYIDTESSPFQTVTVDCTSVDGSDFRAWHRVEVMATATFHSINITNTGSVNSPRIHAIVPWFEASESVFLGTAVNDAPLDEGPPL